MRWRRRSGVAQTASPDRIADYVTCRNMPPIKQRFFAGIPQCSVLVALPPGGAPVYCPWCRARVA